MNTNKKTVLDTANNSLLNVLSENLEGKKILELGCGKGMLLSELKKRKAIVSGIEISNENVRECKKKGLNVLKSDLNNLLPFKDNEFDIVLSVQVLMHLFNPLFSLKEMARVSKKFVALNIPNHLWYRFRLKMLFGSFPEVFGGTKGHVRLFNYALTKKMLRNAGLEIEKQGFTGSIPLSRFFPFKEKIDSLIKKRPELFATGFTFLCKKK